MNVKATDISRSCDVDILGSLAVDGQAKEADGSFTEVIGFRFRDQTLEEVADSLISDARNGIHRKVFFVNAHCANVAARNEPYRSLLRSAPFLYADGVGMAVAARIWGRPLANNINGTDLFPILCEKAAQHDVPIALLGASPGIAEVCAERIQSLCPALRIVFVNHGYLSATEEERALEQIRHSGAKILLVAKGVPTQELWMREHASRTGVPVTIGVGALFDFYSGTVQRAPRLIRKMRMEWVFRFLMEPRRLFRRYIIGNPEFLLRVIKSRLSSRC